MSDAKVDVSCVATSIELGVADHEERESYHEVEAEADPVQTEQRSNRYKESLVDADDTRLAEVEFASDRKRANERPEDRLNREILEFICSPGGSCHLLEQLETPEGVQHVADQLAAPGGVQNLVNELDTRKNNNPNFWLAEGPPTTLSLSVLCHIWYSTLPNKLRELGVCFDPSKQPNLGNAAPHNPALYHLWRSTITNKLRAWGCAC